MGGPAPRLNRRSSFRSITNSSSPPRHNLAATYERQRSAAATPWPPIYPGLWSHSLYSVSMPNLQPTRWVLRMQLFRADICPFCGCGIRRWSQCCRLSKRLQDELDWGPEWLLGDDAVAIQVLSQCFHGGVQESGLIVTLNNTRRLNGRVDCFNVCACVAFFFCTSLLHTFIHQNEKP